jgi:hypothetical protein
MVAAKRRQTNEHQFDILRTSTGFRKRALVIAAGGGCGGRIGEPLHAVL